MRPLLLHSIEDRPDLIHETACSENCLRFGILDGGVHRIMPDLFLKSQDICVFLGDPEGDSLISRLLGREPRGARRSCLPGVAGSFPRAAPYGRHRTRSAPKARAKRPIRSRHTSHCGRMQNVSWTVVRFIAGHEKAAPVKGGFSLNRRPNGLRGC